MVNVKKEKTDFGYVWRMTDSESRYRFAMYIYKDDIETMYLSNVYVEPKYRGKGFGKVILELASNFALKQNASTLFLMTKQDSIAHDLYKKFGYSDFGPVENRKGYVWMKKVLK